mmetsp:Transcript_11299/g.24318  ORF Transcript_11299/g.24318 Transcript_11299/m.24318 type:complete len:94 (+) Transcript_11299:1297-1578(+)
MRFRNYIQSSRNTWPMLEKPGALRSVGSNSVSEAEQWWGGSKSEEVCGAEEMKLLTEWNADIAGVVTSTARARKSPRAGASNACAVPTRIADV